MRLAVPRRDEEASEVPASSAQCSSEEAELNVGSGSW